MNTSKRIAAMLAALTVAGAAPAIASVTVTNGSSAPTYTNTLTFDEVGGPTGTNLPTNSWASVGITTLQSGDVVSNAIVDPATVPGWEFAGGDNAFFGTFGVFINFEQDLTAASFQHWTDAGPATFSSGGALVVALNDGVEVGDLFISNPAFGGFGQEWFNIVATDGMVFDEIRMLGFSFFPTSLMDNLSWQVVPTPGSGAIIALAGVAALRRRRA
jgi:hypothetical protein